MPPNKPPADPSKNSKRKVCLPKTGPKSTKSFFEEYFYGCLVALFLTITIMMKAGGMSGYNAMVLGLWVTGFTWFAGLGIQFFKERGKAPAKKEETPRVKAQAATGKVQLPAGMKPMIGPQWPIKPMQPGSRQTQESPGPADNKKPGFVYERPTLPDRKPKLPANWPSTKGKKPKK